MLCCNVDFTNFHPTNTTNTELKSSFVVLFWAGSTRLWKGLSVKSQKLRLFYHYNIDLHERRRELSNKTEMQCKASELHKGILKVWMLYIKSIIYMTVLQDSIVGKCSEWWNVLVMPYKLTSFLSPWSYSQTSHA